VLAIQQYEHEKLAAVQRYRKNSGVIQEVDSDGDVMVQYSSDSFGYVMHRSTLYGPPPK
jgi:hypothetical protein